jgi:hypothetical protein
MYEYIGILLGARPILHISRIKVNSVSISFLELSFLFLQLSVLHFLRQLIVDFNF